jgi:hypothetical protein
MACYSSSPICHPGLRHAHIWKRIWRVVNVVGGITGFTRTWQEYILKNIRVLSLVKNIIGLTQHGFWQIEELVGESQCSLEGESSDESFFQSHFVSGVAIV